MQQATSSANDLNEVGLARNAVTASADRAVVGACLTQFATFRARALAARAAWPDGLEGPSPGGLRRRCFVVRIGGQHRGQRLDAGVSELWREPQSGLRSPSKQNGSSIMVTMTFDAWRRAALPLAGRRRHPIEACLRRPL